jgi:hypothetical protein
MSGAAGALLPHHAAHRGWHGFSAVGKLPIESRPLFRISLEWGYDYAPRLSISGSPYGARNEKKVPASQARWACAGLVTASCRAARRLNQGRATYGADGRGRSPRPGPVAFPACVTAVARPQCRPSGPRTSGANTGSGLTSRQLFGSRRLGVRDCVSGGGCGRTGVLTPICHSASGGRALGGMLTANPPATGPGGFPGSGTTRCVSGRMASDLWRIAAGGCG